MLENPMQADSNERQNAENVIAFTFQEMHRLGGNDSEYSAISAIQKGLHDGTLSPAEALERIQKLSDYKIDSIYH